MPIARRTSTTIASSPALTTLKARRRGCRSAEQSPSGVHVPRIWIWAFRHARHDRGWLVAEALMLPLALVAGMRCTPVLVYAVLAIGGGWLYPLLTVRLPHAHPGNEPVYQARTVRGRIVPRLLLEQTYHLEHHLYPRVPSHKLPELARRLDPFLHSAGVVPRRVP